MQISKSVEIPRFHKISGNLYEISLRTPLLQQTSQQTQFYCETNSLQGAFLLPLLIARSVSIVSSGLSLPPISYTLDYASGGNSHWWLAITTASIPPISVRNQCRPPVSVSSYWWLVIDTSQCQQPVVAVQLPPTVGVSSPSKDFRAARKLCVGSYVI